MSTQQAAEALNVSARTVQRLVAENRLTPIRIGRSVRFDPADVGRFVESARTPTVPNAAVPARRAKTERVVLYDDDGVRKMVRN